MRAVIVPGVTCEVVRMVWRWGEGDREVEQRYSFEVASNHNCLHQPTVHLEGDDL